VKTGKLNQLIQIEALITSIDSPGGIVKDWVPVGEMEWASVVKQTPGANSEQLYSGQLRSVSVYKVVIRFHENLSPATHRILWDNKILDIVGVDPGTNRSETILICEEGLTNG